MGAMADDELSRLLDQQRELTEESGQRLEQAYSRSAWDILYAPFIRDLMNGGGPIPPTADGRAAGRPVTQADGCEQTPPAETRDAPPSVGKPVRAVQAKDKRGPR